MCVAVLVGLAALGLVSGMGTGCNPCDTPCQTACQPAASACSTGGYSRQASYSTYSGPAYSSGGYGASYGGSHGASYGGSYAAPRSASVRADGDDVHAHYGTTHGGGADASYGGVDVQADIGGYGYGAQVDGVSSTYHYGGYR